MVTHRLITHLKKYSSDSFMLGGLSTKGSRKGANTDLNKWLSCPWPLTIIVSTSYPAYLTNQEITTFDFRS